MLVDLSHPGMVSLIFASERGVAPYIRDVDSTPFDEGRPPGQEELVSKTFTENVSVRVFLYQE